jgi:hypothetical protein
MRVKAVAAILSLIAGLALAFVVESPAGAATGRVITGVINMNVKTGPGLGYASIALLPPGSVVSFSCYVEGQAVTSRYGTETAWDRLDSGGYIPDAWVFTGSSAPIVPLCTGTGVPTSTIRLAQGARSGTGTYYAVSITGFPPIAAVNFSCNDSLRPNGFTVSLLITDGDGRASNSHPCWSPNGGDHWVVAGNVESNHVSWGNGTPPPVTSTPCVYAMKWPDPMHLTVSYGGVHRYYGNAFQAVQNWNNANVGVHMTIKQSSAPADISIVDVYKADSKLGYYGNTDIRSTWKNPKTTDAYLGIPALLATPDHVNISVDQYYIDGRLRQQSRADLLRTYVLTHELGHAFGLAHSDYCVSETTKSVMKSGGLDVPDRTDISIDPYDVREARMLYG